MAEMNPQEDEIFDDNFFYGTDSDETKESEMNPQKEVSFDEPLSVSAQKDKPKAKRLNPKKKAKPKENRVNLRLSDDEYSLLNKKKGSKKLSTFCKDLALENSMKFHSKPVTKFNKIHPDLLKELNAIGRNLNQITRLANTAKKSSSLEIVRLIDSVDLIESLLQKVKDKHDC